MGDSIESYIHRIGRTGRAGEKGFAMTFITDKDFKLAPALVDVLKETQQQVPEKLNDLARSCELTAGQSWDSWNYGGGTGYGDGDQQAVEAEQPAQPYVMC